MLLIKNSAPRGLKLAIGGLMLIVSAEPGKYVSFARGQIVARNDGIWLGTLGSWWTLSIGRERPASTKCGRWEIAPLLARVQSRLSLLFVDCELPFEYSHG